MLALRLFEEGVSSPDITWMVWVVLALFVLMVFLGWWASGRLPKEEEVVSVHEGGEEHAGSSHEQSEGHSDEGAASHHD